MKKTCGEVRKGVQNMFKSLRKIFGVIFAYLIRVSWKILLKFTQSFKRYVKLPKSAMNKKGQFSNRKDLSCGFSNQKYFFCCRKDLSCWIHCVENVQIRSFFWSVFSCIQTEYGLEKTPYLDIFHVVVLIVKCFLSTYHVIKKIF